MTFLADLDDMLVALAWETATRCTCWTDDSHQPQWDHAECGGTGVLYAEAVTVRALFSGRSQWRSRRMEGEHGLGEARITTPLDVRPGYTDARVRDRFTVLAAVGDAAAGTVWLPASVATPFLWQGVHEAWRVQVQGMDLTTRVKAAS